MISTLALAATLFVLPAQQLPKPPEKWTMEKYQLVVLETGPKAGTTPKDRSEALMAEHLKYLESLWSAGKAVAVGPLLKAGERRGIILFDVRTPEEAMELAGRDPFVQAGELKATRYTWFCAKESWGKGPKFMDLETLKFAFLVTPENPPKLEDDVRQKNQTGHMANINKMFETGHLRVAGPILDGGRVRGIFVFRDMPDAELQKLIAPDPHFAAGSLKMEVFGWMTAKGTVIRYH